MIAWRGQLPQPGAYPGSVSGDFVSGADVYRWKFFRDHADAALFRRVADPVSAHSVDAGGQETARSWSRRRTWIAYWA